MNDQRLQLCFRDSSDEDVSHVAAIDIFPDGGAGGDHETNRRSQRGRFHGWSDMLMRGAERLFFPSQSPIPAASEPFPPRAGGSSSLHQGAPAARSSREVLASDALPYGDVTDSTRSLDDGRWGYGVLGSSTSSGTTTTTTASSMTHVSNVLEGPESYEIDLYETVLQYRRTPADLYINIILASLKSGSLTVNAEVFHAASGSPVLIKTFLESGCAEVDDPEVQAVVQLEINKVLNGDATAYGIVGDAQADYLRCLCNVSSARLSLPQMVMLRYSGFEFIKILYDCPYLLNDINYESRCIYCFFKASAFVSLVTNWLSIINTIIFTGAVIWVTIVWFNLSGQSNGYWTILCYVGSYVLAIVATMRAEQDCIREYDTQRWTYPNNNLKIIPILPIFEFLLTYAVFRYELIPDKRQYFVIRRDLKNGIATQQLIHTVIHTIPQVIVQVFLFVDYRQISGEHAVASNVSFRLITASGAVSFVMSTFIYIKMTLFSHSCDPFGFAVMCIDQRKRDLQYCQRITTTSIITHILLFFTSCLLISGAVTYMIFLLNLHDCDGPAISFLAVSCGVAVVSLLLLVIIFLYLKFNRAFGFVCVAPMIMQVCYFPYVAARKDSNVECVLFRYANATWLIPHFIMFGAVCVLFLVWAGCVSYELITGRQLLQDEVDRYLE